MYKKLLIAETVTLLERRISKQLADSFLQSISDGSLIIVYQDERSLRLVKDYFLRQILRDITFFDCANMAVAKSYGIETIFSFDKGYEKNGFRLIK